MFFSFSLLLYIFFVLRFVSAHFELNKPYYMTFFFFCCYLLLIFLSLLKLHCCSHLKFGIEIMMKKTEIYYQQNRMICALKMRVFCSLFYCAFYLPIYWLQNERNRREKDPIVEIFELFSLARTLFFIFECTVISIKSNVTKKINNFFFVFNHS